MPSEISDLRERSGFADTVSDRIWRAWWRDKGVSLQHITARVQESIRSTGVPLTLVAHQGDRFRGTASLIASDMDQRPQYTPWVAAVWVDPEHRGLGVGSSLVAAAAQAAFEQGAERVYLCATGDNSRFYEKQGWITIEPDVDGLNIFNLVRAS
jgi:GNAT superfamily N-acetyltransferase